MSEYTPMMQQYFSVKEQHKNEILFYRLGDFYEMFFDDAKIASKELELVLTGRDCGKGKRAPMCGVPFHSADGYIAKLVSKGYKVAICEQLEDPAEAKGIVDRGVVRIVTPGTVIENSMLDETKNNYLASVCADENGECGLCFIDVSTGAVFVTTCSLEFGGAEVLSELGRFSPVEIIANERAVKVKALTEYKKRVSEAILFNEDDLRFSYNDAVSTVKSQFEKEPEIPTKPALCALGAALSYLKETQKNNLSNIRNVNYYTDEKFMRLDFAARRNLELTATMRNGERVGSLLWILDKTKTAMGKRMLRAFIEQPLISPAIILRRQNAVSWLVSNMEIRDEIASLMTNIYDMERLMTRISYGTANAKELVSLHDTLTMLGPIKGLLKSKEIKEQLLIQIENDIDPLEDIISLIEDAIVAEPPFSIREGEMICDGYNEELDSLREIVKGGKNYLAKIEAEEQEKTGIKKLKIGYNRVFGYYIEVTNSFKDLVPETYIRKQTLANCERYITEELKELEAKVLGAQERITKLEYEIFCVVRDTIAGELARVQKTADAISTLDVLCSFAKVSVDNNYIAPEIYENGIIDIKDGRHPVVEKMLDGAPFVPNDAYLDCGANLAAIITGPNMAGKSTICVRLH